MKRSLDSVQALTVAMPAVNPGPNHTEVAMGLEQVQFAKAKKNTSIQASVQSCDPPADGCGSYEGDEFCTIWCTIWSGCNIYPDWCQIAICAGGAPVCNNLTCYNATSCENYGHPGCLPQPCYVCE